MTKLEKLEEMKECLIQFYEAAGFVNVEEKFLYGKTYEQIEKMYENIS